MFMDPYKIPAQNPQGSLILRESKHNLTTKMDGPGSGLMLIQDHQHSIVWGARPPEWSLFPVSL